MSFSGIKWENVEMASNGFLPRDLEVLVRRAIHEMAIRLLDSESQNNLMQCDFEAAFKGDLFLMMY